MLPLPRYPHLGPVIVVDAASKSTSSQKTQIDDQSGLLAFCQSQTNKLNHGISTTSMNSHVPGSSGYGKGF